MANGTRAVELRKNFSLHLVLATFSSLISDEETKKMAEKKEMLAELQKDKMENV